MKSPITWLSSLMMFGFATTLAAQTPLAAPTDISVGHDAEIRQLRQELQIISSRFAQLGARVITLRRAAIFHLSLTYRILTIPLSRPNQLKLHPLTTNGALTVRRKTHA